MPIPIVPVFWLSLGHISRFFNKSKNHFSHISGNKPTWPWEPFISNEEVLLGEVTSYLESDSS
jgi:hypothetical protein